MYNSPYHCAKQVNRFVSHPSLLCPQPYDALEDSQHLSEGLSVEEGNLGADSPQWSEKGIGGVDASDEYFDSSSWHSGTLSDLSLDSEDPLDSFLRQENTFSGQRTTGSSFSTRSVTARDGHRDATETYVGGSTCCRRKSPENTLNPNFSLKPSTREVDVQHHPSTEKLRLDLHQEKPRLQAVCTDTHVKANTEHVRLKAPGQCDTDTFCPKVYSKADRQEVKLYVQPEKSNLNRLNESRDSETCMIHINTTENRIVTQQHLSTHEHQTSLEPRKSERKREQNSSRERLEISNKLDVEVQNIKLLSTCSVENRGSDRRNTDCNHRQRGNSEQQGKIHEDRQLQAVTVHSKDKCNLYEGVGMYCNETHLKVEPNCTDNICITSTLSKSELSKEIVVASQKITEEHGTATSGTSNRTNAQLKDVLSTQIDVLANSKDVCGSQALFEKNLNGVLSEIGHQVHASVKKPQEKTWASGICFEAEKFGLDGTATKETKPPGTVNEICSSITFSTETTACNSSDTCVTEPTVVSKVSALASPVPLATSEREELENRPDQKHSHSTRLQPLQVAGQAQKLIPNQLVQGGATAKIPTKRQLPSAKKLWLSSCVEQWPDSIQIQCDIHKGSQESLPFHPLSDNLFFSGNRRGVDTSSLLSENLEGEGSCVGSPSPPQSQLGTIQLSEHTEVRGIPKAVARDVPSVIGETLTCPAITESIPASNRKHSDIAQKVITPSNTFSSHCKGVKLELKFPESSCSLQSSLSVLSDPNNNNKESIKGVQREEAVGCFLEGVQSNHKGNERISCPLVESSKIATCDPSEYVEKPQENSEAFLSPLDPRPSWSIEDSEYNLSTNCDRHNHLHVALANESEIIKTEKSVEDNPVGESLECRYSNLGKKEGLKLSEPGLKSRGLMLDSECKDEGHYCSQPGDQRVSLSKSCEKYANEEFVDHIQLSLPDPQQEVMLARYSQTDVSHNLLAVTCLEPIVEANRLLETFGSIENDLKKETNREHVIMRYADKVRSNVDLSGDISSPTSTDHQPQQESLISDELESEESPSSPAMCINSENCSIPVAVADDTSSDISVSSNSDALDEPHFSIWARTNPNKITTKSKTKSNQTGNKGSKFSVFAKMPSFRKAKGSKGAKSEEVTQESSYGGDEGPLSDQDPQRDNFDDAVFSKSDILNQTVHQVFSSSQCEIEEGDCGSFASTPQTRHVLQLVSQGSNGEGQGKPCPDNPLLSQVQTPNGQNYKRSKSNDSLNIRMRFAQAHKSLSSLFESRSMDKENEEQASLATDVDSGKVKQCWRKINMTKEVEHLKRTLSLPEGECSSITSGKGLRDLMSSPLLDRHCSTGSPSSFRALRHTDPISKRGVPEESVVDNSAGCKSEDQISNDLPPFLNDSAGLLSNYTSPVSPLSSCSLATLTNQPSPTWTRSHSMPTEGLTKIPLRPMSPKPNSPRPAAHRKKFHYTRSSRVKSVSPGLLGQSVSIEGLTDPPKRPKTLKPSSSPLCLSLSPLDVAEGRLDSQSNIRLYANGSINKLEVRKKSVYHG